ncbi:MAG: Na/Pi symporter [Acidobacteria bacterium]|nr:Na/Pi symporter [Acidobacteriota bacterium]
MQASLAQTKKTVARVATLALLLYGFLVGLDLMGIAFKLFGGDFAETLITTTANPFVGLFVGILATSLMQSSSTTTSITVTLVASGSLTIEGAIPIIMGANIGTSVTNTVVSLAHVTRREEFRRAFAGATVHDFFNWFAVLILFPVEYFTGYLARISRLVTSGLEGVGGIELFNPLKAAVRPTAQLLSGLTGESAIWTLIIGLALLMLSLKLLVDFLRVVMSERAEQVLHRTLFRSSSAAIVAGMLMTVMVQSSSITTSAIVPLVGAGIVTLEQLFPFTVGANVGTTITAMLAALSTGSPAAVAVAFSHLIFNLSGTLIIYVPPMMRRIPLALAAALGRLGSRNRVLAGVYIIVVFYGIPLLLLFISGAFSGE